MKLLTKIIMVPTMILIILLSGCTDPTLIGPGRTPIIPEVTLKVKLVHIISPTDYVVIEGIVPIDLTNTSNIWIKERNKKEDIPENSPFVSRFELDYPMGLPSHDNVVLLIKASSRKIENIGLVNRGYSFIGTETEEILGEEVTVYRYQFKQIKEGDKLSIIFAGKTKTIGTSLEDKTPIYVNLVTQDGHLIADGQVDIDIHRNQN